MSGMFFPGKKNGAPAESEKTGLAALVDSGYQLIKERRYAEAESVFRKAIEFDGKHHPAWDGLGVALTLQGRYAEAKIAIQCAKMVGSPLGMMTLFEMRIDAELARGTGPESPKAGLDLAAKILEISSGGMMYPQDAELEPESFYRHMIEADPNDSRAYAGLGVALFAEGRNGEAREALNRAIECQPDCFDAWLSLGIVMEEDGEFANACDTLNRAVSMANADTYHHHMATVALLGAFKTMNDFGHLDEASSQLVKKDPENPTVWRARGEVFLRRGFAVQAEEAYRHAAELEPTNPKPWQQMAIALRLLRRYRESEAACRHAIELNPSDESPLGHLGMILLLMNRPDEALEPLERAIDLNPENSDCLYDKARALVALCRYEEAWGFLEKAILLNEDLKREIVKDRILAVLRFNPRLEALLRLHRAP